MSIRQALNSRPAYWLAYVAAAAFVLVVLTIAALEPAEVYGPNAGPNGEDVE